MQKIFFSKIKIIFIFFLLFSFTVVESQNLISVPFTNGFVGDNTANNQSTNAYYLSGASGLGWTNVQFAQSSSSNIFVAQGNDIIGMVIITDANGVEHTITGFIKWRAPSGSVTTLVFQPQAGSNFTLATNGFNGSSSYVINDTKYIGLTFNGQTLSISPVPGTVSGNAATNGLLDALNNYLGSLPSVSIQQTASVTEGITTITLTITLSAASSNTVSVNYATADGSAIVGSDYSLATGTVTFAPGQTSQTITITIINDSVPESTENFTVSITDPINTSILNATCTVTITDNDSVPTISTSNNLSAFISCTGLASSSQSFTISGTSLTNNVVVTAPTGYEVSLTSGSGYASSVIITASGTLTTTSVYVRLAASATGSPSGNIAITSTGATTENIAITGMVTAAPSTGTLSGTQAVCVGSTTTFTSTVSGGTWTSSDTTVATINASTGVITGVAIGTATITYTVTGTGGCADATATRTVSVYAIPSPPIVSQTTICGDVTNISSYVTVTSGHTLNISSTPNTTPSISNVNAPVGQTLSTGIYTIGQSFTPLSNYDLSAVSFYATAANSSAILTVKIYSGNGTAGSLLATKSISNTVPGEIRFNLNSPIQLTQNQIYTFIVETNTSFSHTISWNDNGNPYSGGSYWRYGSNFTTSDIWFKVYKVASYQISQINTISSCQSSAVTITIIPSPSSGTLSGTQAICVGNTTTFTSTVSGGAWTSSDTTVATVNASTGLITGVAAGTATITYTVTGTGGCADATVTRTVTVTAAPSAGTISGTQAVCVGSTTTFTSTVTGGTWTSSNTSIATVNASTGVITGVAPSCGTITASNLNGVTNVANASAGDQIGQSFTAISSGNLSKIKLTLWPDGSPQLILRSYNGNTLASAFGGAIIATSNIATNMPSFTNWQDLATFEFPTAPALVAGQQYVFEIINYSGAYTGLTDSYAGGQSFHTLNIGYAGDMNFQVETCQTAAITYTVAGIGGCADATATGIVTVTAAPSAGALSGTQAICVGNTTTFTSTVSGGAWTSSDTTVATVNASTGLITGVAAGTATITYTVTGTGGCADATATGIVTVTAAPSAGTISGTQAVCVGSTTTFTSTVTGGTWTSSNTSIATVNASTGVITGVAPSCGTITASNLNGVTNVANASAGDQIGQSFTAISSGNLSKIKLTLWPDGSPQLILRSYNGNTLASAFGGAIIATSNIATNMPSFTNWQDLATFEFPTAPALVAGQQYVFEIINYSGAYTGLTDSYAGGQSFHTLNMGYAGDMNFQVETCQTAAITYTVAGIGGCADATATGIVTVTAAPSAGALSGTQAICVGNTTTFTSTVSGGAWTSSDTSVATVNASTGLITGVAAGTATITYTVTGTGGCADATATGIVTVTAAPSAGTISGTQAVLVGNTTTFTSTVTGGAWTSSDTTIATVNSSTGVITGVAVGTATITYTVTGTGGCADATVTRTIVVTSLVDAVNDSPPTITAGDTTTSVITNDILNGSVAVIGTNPGQVTLTGVTVPAGLTLNANGTITVAAGTPSGTYTLTYQICENGATPANCDTATVTIVVSNVINAVNDTPPTITAGDTTSSVITNDTLNGSVAVIGTNPGQVTLTGVTVPTGLTLNANGTITVAAGTPSGTYTLTYQICENGATPANCDTATVTIVVSNVINAVNDTPPTITAGDTTSSVITNDTLNGSAAVIGTNPGQVTLTGVTVPTGLTLNANGTITVASGTSSGTYTLTYQICENGATPANCDTATVTIVVSNVIDAVNDTPPTITAGDTTSSVITNDTLNGSAAVIGTNPGQVTLTGVTVPTGLTLNANGTITVASGTSSGTYTLTYQICENGATPANCDTATVTIVVSNVIDAVNDTPPTITAGDTTSSVITNDTLNGSAAVIGTNPGQVTLTGVTVPTGLTLNANGTITVASGTSSGTYTLTYQICENGATPANCDTATVTIVVSNVIDAVNDTPPTITAGDTTSSVITNDTLNGSAAVIGTNPGQVTLTGVTVPTGLTLNANGTITVASGTSSGTYTLTYQICENGATPANCDTATVTIVVSNVIDAVNDITAPINGLIGTIIPSVITNDTLDGSAAVIGTNPGQVTLTGVTVPTGLTLNANGTITVASGTSSGTYTLTYQICENGATPANCDTASVTVIIGSCLDFPINDCDGDGVTNGQEILNGTNPSDPCSFVLASQTATPSSAWLAADCDGDGVTNGQELLDGTNPLNPCSYVASSQTLTTSSQWSAADCDGDGVTNGQEIIDGTNPNDPCSAIPSSITLPLSQDFLNGDCDGDGLSNELEIGPNPNEPFDPNGNGIPDYLEVNNHTPSDDDLEIFNLVTPNGDGDNDLFVIRNIERYPENGLEIYNRWGVKVYSVDGYGQDSKFFRGISEGRVTVNQVSELPVGTYWYILKYKNASGEWKQRVGYLYLNK